MPAESNTIFALSSGSPPAAIGVVRVSGPEAGPALKALAGLLPPPRVAAVRWLSRPDTGQRLDRALLLWFPGPQSATGEDVAELHLHGGKAVVAAVLDALAGLKGLRHAEAGEFTRRALANGVMDLAEAEGLGDLLTAETEAQRRNALALAGGVLSRKVEKWRQSIVEASARLEAILDFGDEADVLEDDGTVRAIVDEVGREMEDLLATPPAERLKDGVRVVLAGPPNAGKSTLLNALAGRDVAIVTDIPGTTRDLIEAPVAMAGQSVLLIDTAGLREGDNAVERIGIDRAQAAVAAADILLWLGDPAETPDVGGTIIKIAARCDDRKVQGPFDLAVSAISGEGMTALRQLLMRHILMLLPRESELAINVRQRQALSDALDGLALGRGSDDILLLGEGLRLARAALDRITGRAGIEDVLDNLFRRFCIGK